MIKSLLLTISLSACMHSAPIPVAASSPPPSPTNYAYNAARANFPTGDAIALGEHTAIVREGFILAMCLETDAQHHTQCVAIKDYTPPKTEETKKTEPDTSKKK